MRQNHWSEISGSIATPERWLCPTEWTYGSRFEIAPSSSSAATTASRASATGEAREALTRRFVHAPVLADHRDLLEPVLSPDLEVVGVVARRDLERAGAELRIDVVVRDDRQPPPDERQDRRLPIRWK